jgi:hypothetical protein
MSLVKTVARNVFTNSAGQEVISTVQTVGGSRPYAVKRTQGDAPRRFATLEAAMKDYREFLANVCPAPDKDTATVNKYDPCEDTGETVPVHVGDWVMYYSGGYEQHHRVHEIIERETGTHLALDVGGGRAIIKAAKDCYDGCAD